MRKTYIGVAYDPETNDVWRTLHASMTRIEAVKNIRKIHQGPLQTFILYDGLIIDLIMFKLDLISWFVSQDVTLTQASYFAESIKDDIKNMFTVH